MPQALVASGTACQPPGTHFATTTPRFTRRWAEGCAALHDLHQLEAGETLGTALEHGTYSKVSEAALRRSCMSPQSGCASQQSLSALAQALAAALSLRCYISHSLRDAPPPNPPLSPPPGARIR